MIHLGYAHAADRAMVRSRWLHGVALLANVLTVSEASGWGRSTGRRAYSIDIIEINIKN